jgi:hypothetical protein
MTHSEFFPYESYHIRFKLIDGTELSGVLFQAIENLDFKKPDTIFKYIPTSNMIEWKKAEQNNNKEVMERLQREIDIEKIVWAERMKY